MAAPCLQAVLDYLIEDLVYCFLTAHHPVAPEIDRPPLLIYNSPVTITHYQLDEGGSW